MWLLIKEAWLIMITSDQIGNMFKLNLISNLILFVDKLYFSGGNLKWLIQGWGIIINLMR